MAIKVSTPGVYIEEIPTLPPSVAEVESAIPAFIGFTEKAETPKGKSLDKVPTKIYNLDDYEWYFGKGFPLIQANPVAAAGAAPAKPSNLSIKITEKNKDGQLISLDILITPPIPDETNNFILYDSLRLYFANGGGPCYIVSAGKYEELAPAPSTTPTTTPPDKATKLLEAIEAVKDYDEPTLLVCPEAVFLDKDEYAEVVQEMVKQCANQELMDRFAIIDVPILDGDREDVKRNPMKSINTFRGANGTATGVVNINLSLDRPIRRYAAAYYPYLETTYKLNFEFDKLKVTEYVVNDKNDGTVPSIFKEIASKSKTDLKSIDGSELYNLIKAEFDKNHIILPPSPAIAGIYAQTDNTRGVWKAPANIGLLNVVGPTLNISNLQQGQMNIDSNNGLSVNVIRQFPGLGNIVWGARTLDGNDNEWRYVNVRRFFIMVEESIKKSINWAVFEPNTSITWVRVKGMIENYLFQKWRDGALAGAKPEEAYFVRVGLGQTMTSQDVLEGKLIAEIGMAVARPAEFIILKFMHKLQTS
ncbi:MAG: phage tail sheath subtilisin-like domain-containing protein [Microscillaceae bacterium]|nr:phage tail sheath subtilisin-like domain-containing protein [Microscillaceae bacterium]